MEDLEKLYHEALEGLKVATSAMKKSAKLADPTRYHNESPSNKIYWAQNALWRAEQVIRKDLLKQIDVPSDHELSEVQDSDQELHQTHESFGCIALSQPRGSMKLVGTMVDKLPMCMELRVYRSQRVIDQRLHTERYVPHPWRPMLTVRLSIHQWALLISSPGLSGGVPCTIGDIDGVRMEDVPEEVTTPLEQIAKNTQKEARSRTDTTENDYFKTLRELDTLIEGLTTKKKAKEVKALTDALREMVVAPREAALWAARRMSEDAEATLEQAKVEIAANLQHLIKHHQLESSNGTDRSPTE